MRKVGILLVPFLGGCMGGPSIHPPPGFAPPLAKRAVLETKSGTGRPGVLQSALDYVLRPGDLVEVKVWNQSTLNGEYELDSNGEISMPLVGRVQAAGLTEREFQDHLTELFREYFVDPHVDASVLRKMAYISGAVDNAGSIEIRGLVTLDQLIIMAGGLTTDADLSNVSVVRQGDDGPETLYFDASSDNGSGIMVQPGDRVSIPRGYAQTVKLLGEVRKQGFVRWREGMMVSDAIIESGGFTDFAARNKVEIRRGAGDDSEVIRAKVKDILEGRVEDVPLLPGDIVRVPSSFL